MVMSGVASVPFGAYAPYGVASPPAWGSVVLEMDILKDGTSWVDLTADVLAVETVRGRDYASMLTGRSQAGSLQATLKNTSGNYSSFNSSGIYYGNVLPGRPIRLRSLYPTAAILWTGYLDRIEPAPGRPPMATLYAYGAIAKLVNNNISPAPLVNTTTGPAVAAILAAAGWTGNTSIDTGVNPIGNWFADQKEALSCVHEMEETEAGLLWEDVSFGFVFEGRYNRTQNHMTSVATFTDAGGSFSYSSLAQQDPIREIFNLITATIQPMHVSTLAVLWTLSGLSPFLAAGQSITFNAVYSAGAYVSAWTTPVVGTDILHDANVADGDISVTVVKNALSMQITIKNNHATNSTNLSLVQARGIPVLKDNAYQLSSLDAASQGKYGVRSYPLPSQWYQNANDGQSGIDYFMVLKKDPHPILDVTIEGGKSSDYFANCVQRQISDRVTLAATGTWTKLGVNQDFYIETIRHSIRADQALKTTFSLSPVTGLPTYWIMGDSTYSVLGSTTIVGY